MRLRVNGEREPLGRPLAERVPHGDRKRNVPAVFGVAADDAGLRVELQPGRELARR